MADWSRDSEAAEMRPAMGYASRCWTIILSALLAAGLAVAALFGEPSEGGSPIAFALLMATFSVPPAMLLAGSARGRIGTGVASLFLAALVVAVAARISSDDSSTASLGVFSIFGIGTMVGAIALGVRGAVDLYRRHSATGR